MKISWGTKIAALYIGFVLMIITLVAAATMTKTDLVADNYYQQEIGFQKRIDATKAALELYQPASLTESTNNIDISFPAVFKGQDLKAKVHFYAAANSSADKNFDVETTDAQWQVSKSKLAHAAYEVQISWQSGGKDYYQSLPLNLLTR